MPWWKRVLCRLILLLDYVPAYRRSYRVNPKTKDLEPPVWGWWRHGCWGTLWLDRRDWYWPYTNLIMKDVPWERVDEGKDISEDSSG
jgi:hypothetical protein